MPTGTSIRRFLYWDVVEIVVDGEKAWIVTDRSLKDRKPQKVWGPGSKADAIAWAHQSALLFQAVHGQLI